MSAALAITPVILSGGSGTRLWPLSRAAKPKQFLQFTPGGTMLELTLERTPDGTFADPVIVCNAAHADMVAGQCGGRDATLILEPAARNTAPAIALAALALPGDALMLVSPSDHVIVDVAAFHAAIASAAPLAAQGWLVTFGVNPSGPETGYGYIRRGAAVAGEICRVERFVEKPDAATAQAYLDEGNYSWNAGIFLFRADAYLEALASHAPEILAAARAAMATAVRDGAQIRPDAQSFAASPSDSIDYAVMEKADKVAVVPVDMGWSDIGSWDALYELLDKDEDGNAHVGDVLALDSKGCLVRSDGPVVTLAGVEDLIVIATSDTVMVLPRGKSQDVKKIVEGLKARKHPVLDR
tara:strand:- start:61152 stop:62216 length:1065 start_codon:yes stop_codon:yes gene_type:complete